MQKNVGDHERGAGKRAEPNEIICSHTEKNPEKADSTQSSDGNRGSYPDTHR